MKKYSLVFAAITLAFFVSGAAVANLPVPPSPPDHYLDGVRKIVILPSATIPLDLIGPFYDLRDKSFKIDHDLLETGMSNRLESFLKSEVKNKIVVQPYHSVKVDPNNIKDEDILLIGFNFGFQTSQFEGKDIILVTVYPTIQRLPPPQMRGDRTSGFYQHATGKEPAYSFILQKGKATTTAQMQMAAEPYIKKIAAWLNVGFSDTKVQNK